MSHHRRSQCYLLTGLASLAIVTATAAAGVVDTFDNNINLGTWRLTTNPNVLYQIEPTGGNPGAYLHGQVSTAVPAWFVSNPAANPFLGDYAAEGVASFSFDMKISGGAQVPNRNMTLHLLTTLGTGNPSLGIEAYFVGTDISTFPVGWHNYSYAIDATSLSIPSGWAVFKGNGMPGNGADWHNLMTHIENVAMALGTPGFAYPSLGVWDLGLDNVTLATVPAPGAAIAMLLACAGSPLRRRRQYARVKSGTARRLDDLAISRAVSQLPRSQAVSAGAGR